MGLLSQLACEQDQKSQFWRREKFFMNVRAETFFIIIIGPKIIFWANFSQIGGYVFSKNGHLSIPNFGIFCPVFGPWNLKCTKLDHLGAKGTKMFGKICLVALIEIWIPQTPQKPPLTPKHP